MHKHQQVLSQQLDLNFAAVRPEYSLQLFFMSKVHLILTVLFPPFQRPYAISLDPCQPKISLRWFIFHVHWTVSRNILLIHELLHGLENASENAQINFYFFIYILTSNINKI
jgi:hypothetical protein